MKNLKRNSPTNPSGAHSATFESRPMSGLPSERARPTTKSVTPKSRNHVRHTPTLAEHYFPRRDEGGLLRNESTAAASYYEREPKIWGKNKKRAT